MKCAVGLAIAIGICLSAGIASTDSDGFTPLFTGDNLGRWVGDKKDFAIDDGVLKCTSRRHLYTKEEYANFVLRFEFKLTDAANNGIGVWVNPGDHAAYEGLELQILDNDCDKYRDRIEPYQAHGSVYGVVPAKRGHLKPDGEWNEQEVTVNGRQVTVVLNGVTITDANLDEASKGGTPDGRDHPGLARSNGRIALLGHGTELYFRNIYVKRLPD